MKTIAIQLKKIAVTLQRIFFKLRSLNITLQSIVVFYNLNSPFVINGDYEIAVFIK